MENRKSFLHGQDWEVDNSRAKQKREGICKYILIKQVFVIYALSYTVAVQKDKGGLN